jgi:hypothetical protein
MSRARQGDPDLDSLIEEITVDCYGEDEQLTGFENAFHDIPFPCPGTVVGQAVEGLTVATAANRRELIATCRRGGRHYEVALLDVDFDADAATSRLLAAYRRRICA